MSEDTIPAPNGTHRVVKEILPAHPDSYLIIYEIRTAISARTKLFQINSKHGALLGEVKWFGRWRQYAFFPYQNTIYNTDCLREISDFCAVQTHVHWKVKK